MSRKSDKIHLPINYAFSCLVDAFVVMVLADRATKEAELVNDLYATAVKYSKRTNKEIEDYYGDVSLGGA